MKERKDFFYPEEAELDDSWNHRWGDYVGCGVCRACEGKGFVYVADGPDDVVGEDCPVCEGSGHCECEDCVKKYKDLSRDELHELWKKEK